MTWIDGPSKNTDPPRSCSCHPDDRPAVCQKRHALSACKAELTLTIPATVLEWCAANPEAAKGLAEGTMVAVPREPTAAMVDAAFPFIDRRLVYRAMIGIAASTPVTSDEAQGETT